MQHLKRANESCNYGASPPKRQKDDLERWRPWGASQSTFNYLCGTEIIGSQQTPDRDSTHSAASRGQSETPSRPALIALILDALRCNPDGLRTNELLEWLKVNRPEAFLDRDEEKIKISMHSIISAQSRKKEPTIWKYKDDNSKKPGYIWRLANVHSEAICETASRQVCDGPLLNELSDDMGEPTATIWDDHSEVHHARSQKTPMNLPNPTSSSRQHLADSIQDVNHVTQDISSGNDLSKGRENAAEQNGATTAQSGDSPSLPEAHGDSGAQLSTELYNDLAHPEQDDSHAVCTHQAQSEQQHQIRDAVSSTTSTREQQDPPSAPSDDQLLFYGQIIIRIQKLNSRHKQLSHEIDVNRASLPNLDALKNDVQQTATRAEELAEAAQDARRIADDAVRQLGTAREQELKIMSTEDELRHIVQDQAEARSELSID